MYLQRRCHVFFNWMKMRLNVLFLILIVGCGMDFTGESKDVHPAENTTQRALSAKDSLLMAFSQMPAYYSDGFDFPVGKPNGKGYYNAQPFKKNNHLGDDWNGNGGGNSDFGDTVYAVSNGYVTQSINFFGGWGKVVRIVHVLKSKNDIEVYESLYAHMDEVFFKKNQWVKKGQALGTIGDAEKHYLAHLHLEIRNDVDLDLGGGYGTDTKGYLDPSLFISKHRKIDLE